MNKQEIEKSLDDFINNMLEVTTSVINDKEGELEKSTLQLGLWYKKAQMLASKFKACLYCGGQKDWVPKTMKCKNCSDGN